MTPEQLRAHGLDNDADRLSEAVSGCDLWNAARTTTLPTSPRAIALSLFGSKRFDELADVLGIEPYGHSVSAPDPETIQSYTVERIRDDLFRVHKQGTRGTRRPGLDWNDHGAADRDGAKSVGRVMVR